MRIQFPNDEIKGKIKVKKWRQTVLTADTKRHIDTARQILVGKVPDPKAQIDQITNALIYKFMDDMDIKAKDAGGKASFFTGDLEKYAWRKLMDPRKGAQERLNMYVEALEKFGAAKQLPQLFRDIFRQAFLPYRDPETLNLFLKEIEYFDYNHSEDLGNAFEYLLSIMGSQGDAGQFRTPRHIIDFIVDVIDPDKDDTILDPACGTAGFLISAYKHIAEKHDGVDENGKKNHEKPLTHQEKQKLMNNLEGYDISSDMVKLARVNMYLHGNNQPKIYEYDSLTSQERWGDNFSVIMANPPFMSPKGGIRPHNKFGVESSRAEVLFVDYIMSHLKQNGRAGIIVPEGVIFQGGKAYKQLRKALIEDGLMAVISLPSGVFNPYAGVKTSILIFDNNRSKKSDQIIFAKVENDGFSLGAQRRPTPNQNDLPIIASALKQYRQGKLKTQEQINECLEDIAAFQNPEAFVFTRVPEAHLVERSEILESNDCSLSASRYAVEVNNKNQKWPMLELGEVLEYEQPTKYIVESTDYKEEYSTPVLTAGKSFVLGYTNETSGIFSQRLPVIIFDDFTTATKLVDFPFKVKSSAMKILHAKPGADTRYVYYVMQKIKFEPVEHKRFWISQYSKIKIPLPPIGVQRQIIEELDGYQKIIDGARQIIANYKPTIKIDPSWPIVKVGDVFKTSSGGTPSKSKPEFYNNGTIPWLGSGEVSQGEISSAKNNITEEALAKSSAKVFPVDSVLIAMYGATVGQVGILKFESATNQAVCAILPEKTKALPDFLYLLMKGYRSHLIDLSTGGAQPNISQQIIRNMEIPLPPLDEQQLLLEKFQLEIEIIDLNKQLIKIHEQKIKDKIAEVWGE